MKVGQLIEYTMRNIFNNHTNDNHRKITQKNVLEKPVSDAFLEN